MPTNREPERPRRLPRGASGSNRATRRVPRRSLEHTDSSDIRDLAPDPVLDDPELDSLDETAARRRAESEAERRAILQALLVDDPFDDEEPEPVDGPEPYVTVVVVGHDGAQWLPETLAALAAQTRAPDHVVGVDTGSSDDTAELLTRAFGSTAVRSLPRDTGYGAAIAAGLAAHEVPAALEDHRREWIWLLHDDSAPEPDALEKLLSHARYNPSAGVLGAKAVDWTYPDRLVDLGLTTDRAGRRISDLEYFELDQGQRDQPRDVLAVGTAGALIRRSTWDQLGGLDPDLPLLRDDIDFGWRATLAGYRVVVVPAARVRHARATLTDVRTRDALPGSLRRHDREHGLRVVLANSGFVRGGLLGLPQVVFAALVRAFVLLVTRRPVQARDEAMAALTLIRPVRLFRARRRRRRARSLSPHAATGLLVRTGTRIRTSLMASTDVFSGSGALAGSALPSDDDDIPGDDTTLIRRILVRPSVGLVVGLTVVGLVTERSLLHGGTLSGGRLLPVTDSARELWRNYAASWHGGGYGSSTAASPWQPVLAALSLPFGGDPRLAVIVLLLLALPLAGLSAWFATRRTGLSTRLRLWAAVTYALLPPTAAAVDGGRFDAVVAIIGIPLLLSAGHRLFTQDPKVIGWNHPFAAGFGLAFVTAFSPPVYLLAVFAIVIGAVITIAASSASRRISATRRALAGVVMALIPPMLLFPYATALSAHPRQLLVGLGEAGGIAGQTGQHLGPFDLLFLRPGGDLQPSGWMVIPLLVAAGVGLLRRGWWRVAAVAGSLVIGSYAFALVVARTGALHDSGSPYGWPGPELAMAGAGLLLAALVAARRARETYATLAFGIRQPLGVLVALAAIAMPVALALSLMTSGTDGPLHRSTGSDLPSFVGDDATRDPGQRLLRLDVQPSGTVGFRLTAVDGSTLGDEDLFPSNDARLLVNRLVADLVSNRGTDAAELLSTFHVTYVALPADEANSSGIGNVLDAQPGLSRFAVPGDTLLWQLLVPSARMQLLSGGLARAAQTAAPADATLGRGPLLDQVAADPPIDVAAGVEGARTYITDGSGDRLLVVSDARGGGWHATLNGRTLAPVTAWRWAQAFVVPDTGGQLRVWHGADERRVALIVEVSLFGVVVVLGAPSVRRRRGVLDLEDELEPELDGEPEDLGVPARDRAEADA